MYTIETIRLFLVPNHAIGTRDSVAGKAWHATLQYVLRLKGIVGCYPSRQFEDGQLWLFLVWADAESREWFHRSTLGIGLMLPFMITPPEVFLLDETAFDILQPERHISLHLYQFHRLLSQVETNMFTEYWNQQWASHRGSKMWLNKNTGSLESSCEMVVSFIGLIPGLEKPSGPAVASTVIPPDVFKEHFLTLTQASLEESPHPLLLTLPESTPDLLRDMAHIYASTTSVESHYIEENNINNLGFRPLCALGTSSWFPYNPEHGSYIHRYEHYMCIITLYFARDFGDVDDRVFPSILKEVASQPGMKDLYWCKDDQFKRRVRLLTTWDDETKFLAFERLIYDSHSTLKDRSYMELDPKLTPFPIDHFPDWDDGSIVEAMNFTFPISLTKEERTAFMWYLDCFLVTLGTSRSRLEQTSVADPSGPFSFFKELGENFLLLIRWSSLPERRAWFKSFAANEHAMSGHAAHLLALLCPETGGTMTVIMHRHEIARDGS